MKQEYKILIQVNKFLPHFQISILHLLIYHQHGAKLSYYDDHSFNIIDLAIGLIYPILNNNKKHTWAILQTMEK
jgi:hypothetical protein